MQAEDGDPHSSSLFRLLNFEIMKKKSIPDSCEKYLKSINYRKNFKSCIDLTSSSSNAAVPEKSDRAKTVR